MEIWAEADGTNKPVLRSAAAARLRGNVLFMVDVKFRLPFTSDWGKESRWS